MLYLLHRFLFVFLSTAEIDNIRGAVFLQLQKDFPNDIGTLSMFFLNLVQLEPGQAIFLKACEPHAYLAGNCVECMACSDNVIRAGLTPKFKDVDQLLRLINYNGASAESKIFQPRRIDEQTELFAPAVRDFALARIVMRTQQQQQQYRFANRCGGSVLMVLTGQAVLRTYRDAGTDAAVQVRLQRGSAVFLPATDTNIELSIEAGSDAEDFVAYQAMANDFV